MRTKLLILTTHGSNASLTGCGAPSSHLDWAHLGSVLHFTNQKLFWHSGIGGHYEWQEQFCSALYGGYGGEEEGDTASWRERNINYQVCSPLITILTHTMFCSSFGLFQFTNDSANQLLSAEAFLARKQSSIYKTEFKRWLHLGCRSPIYWYLQVATRARRW